MTKDSKTLRLKWVHKGSQRVAQSFTKFFFKHKRHKRFFTTKSQRKITKNTKNCFVRHKDASLGCKLGTETFLNTKGTKGFYHKDTKENR